MNTVKFKHYKLTYHRREHQILVPENTAQFWTTYWHHTSDFWPEVTIDGNREGLEALRDACAALSLEGNMAVYFPCRKNGGECLSKEKERYALHDLVLMKPNSLKISDWKDIRRRISKMETGEWIHTFQEEFEDMHTAEKYRYRTDGKKVFRFDTVFYIIPQFAYPERAAEIEWLLQQDLESDYRNWQHNFWLPFYNESRLSTEVGFLDEDIEKERNRK